MEVTLALANYPITFFDSFSNWQAHTRRWVESAAAQGAQLLVFPEYGAMELTSLLPEALRSDLHEQLEAMQTFLPGFIETFEQLAKAFSCRVVAPSFPVRAGGRMVNRAYVTGPDGIGYQDKWNMTRFENESWSVQQPEQRELSVFQAPWGNFGVQICYDVEFPGASSVLAHSGCTIILAPSCTETLRGATRVHIGARARAMEQQLYVGVSQTCNNALWSPAVDINYGYGAVYSTPDALFPETGILAEGVHQQEGWVFQTLDLSKVSAIRSEGQVLNFRDFAASESAPVAWVNYFPV
jgi:predicted amidohydrolase